MCLCHERDGPVADLVRLRRSGRCCVPPAEREGRRVERIDRRTQEGREPSDPASPASEDDPPVVGRGQRTRVPPDQIRIVPAARARGTCRVSRSGRRGGAARRACPSAASARRRAGPARDNRLHHLGSTSVGDRRPVSRTRHVRVRRGVAPHVAAGRSGVARRHGRHRPRRGRVAGVPRRLPRRAPEAAVRRAAPPCARSRASHPCVEI